VAVAGLVHHVLLRVRRRAEQFEQSLLRIECGSDVPPL
jgi:hypothetical protein